MTPDKPASETTVPNHQNADKHKLPGAFDLFRPSAQALGVNTGTIIGLFVTPIAIIIPFAFVLGVLFGLAQQSGPGANQVLPGLISLALYPVFGVVYAFFSIALLIATLKSAAGEKISYGAALGQSKPFFWRFLGLVILIALIVIVGLILLIVPGIFMIKRYLLAPYYLVDGNLRIRDALRRCPAETNQVGGVWGILGVLVLISLINIIPVVGWIGAIAVNVIYLSAPAIRYRQIRERMTAMGSHAAKMA